MINLKDIPSGAIPIIKRTDGDAAEAASERAFFYADVDYKILSAGFIPDSDITGADNDYRSISFVDKGTAGAGTDAVKAAVDFKSGVDAADFDYYELISKSDAKTITKGHVVSFKSAYTTTGTGMALPAGAIVMFVWPTSE